MLLPTALLLRISVIVVKSSLCPSSKIKVCLIKITEISAAIHTKPSFLSLFIFLRSFKHIDQADLRKDVEKLDWSPVYNCGDIDA